MARTPATVDQRRQQLQIIWRAMLAAVAVYGIACFVVLPRSMPRDEEAAVWRLRYLCSGVAIAIGGLSVWWRRHFLAADSPGAAARPAINIDTVQQHGVITWALSDAVGVCGLLLAFWVHNAGEYIPFAAAAGALFLLHRPSNLPWARLDGSDPVKE